MTSQNAETKPTDQSATPSLFQRVVNTLQKPVDGSSVASLRIAFGVIMIYEVFYYWGIIDANYITPKFNFYYEWFPFIKPLPGNGLYYFFVVAGLASLGVAIGAWYRVSAAVACLSYTYWFLLDQAKYLNHFYLVCLLAFILIFCDANRWASIDAWRKKGALPTQVPFWNVAMLRGQMVVVYFFGGIAKLDSDWLSGHPLHEWLGKRTELAVLGPLFEYEWVRTYVFSHGGLVFDLLIGPALLWKKTRVWALIPLAAFHLTNAYIFTIGIFPWLALASTVVFFEPDLPRRAWLRLEALWSKRKTAPVPVVRSMPAPSARWVRASTWFVVGWFSIQIFLPLRHFLYSSVVHWTEEGHRFAWHMKLRSKRGWTAFVVTDRASGQVWIPDLTEDLTGRQIGKMSTRPYLMMIYARRLRERALERGFESPDVRVHSWASLNGRPYQPLVSSNVDLSLVEYPLFGTASWIVPLDIGTQPGNHKAFNSDRAWARIRQQALSERL